MKLLSTLLICLGLISISDASNAQMMISDQYGNALTSQDIRLPADAIGYTGPTIYSIIPSTPALQPSGYFQIYYTPNSGFDPTSSISSGAIATDRLAVIDQLLKDISAFINSPLSTSATTPKVRILLEDIGNLNVPANVVGVGNSFYFYPNATAFPSARKVLMDNSVWLTIKTGRSAYTSTNFPWLNYGLPNDDPFYHAYLAFDFSNFNFHTDLSTSPTINEFDLYSIALHELTHALGFHSLIRADGTSVLNISNNLNPALIVAANPCNCFNRYDLHLQTQPGPGSAPAKKLITLSTPSCPNYGLAFNSLLTATVTTSPAKPNLAVLSPGYPAFNNSSTVPTPDNTACSTAIDYAGTITQPVYTSDIFSSGSSLSHFEDQCKVPAGFSPGIPASKNLYFTMGKAAAMMGATGERRYLKPEERAVLCDIGYSVNASFGSVSNRNDYSYGSGCAGLGVAGVNDGSLDGFYQYTVNPGQSITIKDVLANDIGANHIECLEQAFGNAADQITNVTATSFTFTPANVAGDDEVRVLRYVPASNTEKGNTTYIFIKVMTNHCTDCFVAPGGTDLVNNGGFEFSGGGAAFCQMGHSFYRSYKYLNCWTEYAGNVFNGGTPSILTAGGPTGCAAVSPPSIPSSTQYVNLIGFPGNFINPVPNSALIQNVLVQPLQSGGSYTLSFNYRCAGNVTVGVFGSQELMVPQYELQNFPGIPFLNTGKFIALDNGATFPAGNIALTSTSGSWATQTHSIIIPAAPGNPQYPYLIIGALQGNIDLDNISITPATLPAFPTASALLSYYGSTGTITTNNIIEIPLSFTIDADLNLKNCPRVRCAPYAQMLLQNGKTLSITDGTVMRERDCDAPWKGIVTYASASPIAHVIIDKSEIHDMTEGVLIEGSNTLSSTDSKYIDDRIGIDFFVTPTAYTDVVTGNEIYGDHYITEFGIKIRDCNDVQIGNLTTGKGNSFHHLKTGIYIEDTKAGPNPYLGPARFYKLYNNDFHDIYGGRRTAAYPYVSASITSDREGSAIYAFTASSGKLPWLSSGTLVVDRNAGNASQFQACDKGVFLQGPYSASIKNTKMNVGWGIICEQTDKQNYTIQGNSIQNAVVGMSFYGLNAASVVDGHNVITTKYITPPSGTVPGAFTDGKGIEISTYPYTYLTTIPFSIDGNDISSYSGSGAAISLPSPPGSVSVTANNIYLYNYNNPSSKAFATISGISASNTSYLFFSRNVIDNAAPKGSATIGMAGIRVNYSHGFMLSCNQVSNMDNGFQIEGNCYTGWASVISNVFTNHKYGMHFRHIGTEGTLGDIGTMTNDCRNQFSGTYSGNYNLFRQSTCPPSAVPTNKIYTTLLVTSGGSGGCIYAPTYNPGAAIPLSCGTVGTQTSLYGSSKIADSGYEHSVATGLVLYSEYQPGTLWLEQSRLFHLLRLNPAEVTSGSTFNTFYQASLVTAMDNIDEVNRLLLVVDTAQDSAAFATGWQAAWSANAAMQLTNQQAQNEQAINEIYLRFKLGGMDTLSVSDSNTIATLALQCPLVGGNAVYKARSLYLHYQPLMYFNDFGLCNYPDANDTTNGIFDAEEAALAASDSNGGGSHRLSPETYASLFRLYPNPVTGTLTIEFTEAGQLEISDITGRKLKTIQLADKEGGKTSINMSGMPAGVCICRYFVEGKLKEIRKVTVLHE